jgi:hypothetical protein
MLYSKAYFGVGYPKKPETSWRTTANLVSICGLEECDIAWQARASTLLLQHRRSYLANSNEGLRVSLAITNKTLRLEVNDIPFTLDPRMPTGIIQMWPYLALFSQACAHSTIRMLLHR